MRRSIAALFGWIVIACSVAYTQEIEYVTSILHTGIFSSIVVSNNYAYCSTRAFLFVLDIANPSALALVAAVPGLQGDNTILRGNYIYSVRYYGYHPESVIIDISQPGNPIGISRFGGSAHDICIDSCFAYLARSQAGLQIWDISNPSSPIEMGDADVFDYATGIDVSGAHAYIADSDSGLTIFNVSDPHNPVLAGHYDGPGNQDFRDVKVMGDYAYVAVTWENQGLQVFDISTPSNPYLEGYLPLIDGATEISISGNYAYLNDQSLHHGHAYILDISHPAYPELVSVYDSMGFVGGIAGTDSILYIAGGTNFGQIGAQGLVHAVDITDASQPNPLGSFEFRPTWDCAFAITGNYAYFATLSLYIVDISNPEAPIVVGNYGGLSSARVISIDDDYAYSADENRFQIFSLSDPTQPSQVGYFWLTDNYTNSLVVDHPYAYLTSSSEGLDIVDIFDPTQPQVIGNYRPQGWARDAAISGGYAYLAEDYYGLRVVDIHDPLAPLAVGGLSIDGPVTKICVFGDYAFISGYYLYAVNITDPVNPALADTFDLDVHIADMCLQENLLYLLTYSPGTITVLNISNPIDPIIQAQFPHLETKSTIRVSGDLIFADIGRSLAIFRYPVTAIDNDTSVLPASLNISAPYPNPFNSATTISYSLPAPGPVNLDIYDILGRKMATLFTGIQPAGEHRVAWDAIAFSSGLYFARLTAGERAETVRMVLVK